MLFSGSHGEVTAAGSVPSVEVYSVLTLNHTRVRGREGVRKRKRETERQMRAPKSPTLSTEDSKLTVIKLSVLVKLRLSKIPALNYK